MTRTCHIFGLAPGGPYRPGEKIALRPTATTTFPKGGPMMRIINRLLTSAMVAVFLLSVVSGSLLRAQGVTLSDDQVKERLAYLENVLKAGQPRAETWFYGWLGAYSVGGIAGGILAGTQWADKKIENGETVPDRESAESMLVSGATFVLGIGSMIVDPFEPALGPDELPRLPENSQEERRSKLERAEKMLRDCAQRERRGRSLTTHLLNIGANAAGAVVIKAAFRQSWGSALVNFASSEAVSLLTIFTQPTRAVRDLQDYEAKFQGGKGAEMPAPAEHRWSLGVGPGGLTLRYDF